MVVVPELRRSTPILHRQLPRQPAQREPRRPGGLLEHFGVGSLHADKEVPLVKVKAVEEPCSDVRLERLFDSECRDLRASFEAARKELVLQQTLLAESFETRLSEMMQDGGADPAGGGGPGAGEQRPVRSARLEERQREFDRELAALRQGQRDCSARLEHHSERLDGRLRESTESFQRMKEEQSALATSVAHILAEVSSFRCGTEKSVQDIVALEARVADLERSKDTAASAVSEHQDSITPQALDALHGTMKCLDDRLQQQVEATRDFPQRLQALEHAARQFDDHLREHAESASGSPQRLDPLGHVTRQFGGQLQHRIESAEDSYRRLDALEDAMRRVESSLKDHIEAAKDRPGRLGALEHAIERFDEQFKRHVHSSKDDVFQRLDMLEDTIRQVDSLHSNQIESTRTAPERLDALERTLKQLDEHFKHHAESTQAVERRVLESEGLCDRVAQCEARLSGLDRATMHIDVRAGTVAPKAEDQQIAEESISPSGLATRLACVEASVQALEANMQSLPSKLESLGENVRAQRAKIKAVCSSQSLAGQEVVSVYDRLASMTEDLKILAETVGDVRARVGGTEADVQRFGHDLGRERSQRSELVGCLHALLDDRRRHPRQDNEVLSDPPVVAEAVVASVGTEVASSQAARHGSAPHDPVEASGGDAPDVAGTDGGQDGGGVPGGPGVAAASREAPQEVAQAARQGGRRQTARDILNIIDKVAVVDAKHARSLLVKLALGNLAADVMEAMSQTRSAEEADESVGDAAIGLAEEVDPLQRLMVELAELEARPRDGADLQADPEKVAGDMTVLLIRHMLIGLGALSRADTERLRAAREEAFAEVAAMSDGTGEDRAQGLLGRHELGLSSERALLQKQKCILFRALVHYALHGREAPSTEAESLLGSLPGLGSNPFVSVDALAERELPADPGPLADAAQQTTPRSALVERVVSLKAMARGMQVVLSTI